MTKITEEGKRIIIKKFLKSKTLDQINEETGRSKGSIFNTVHAWKKDIGEDNVEEIRRFIKILNHSDISINECITGFRITNMLKQFNVNDEFELDYFDPANDNQLSGSTSQLHLNTQSDLTDQIKENRSSLSNDNNELYEFISKIYEGCKDNNIRPEDLVEWAKNLIEFAPTLDDMSDKIDLHKEPLNQFREQYTIPKVSELSTYIEGKKIHIFNLEKQLKVLTNRIQDFESKLNNKTEQLDNLYQKENSILQYLKWYSDLQDVLKNNYNIDIKKIYRNFAKAINDFEKYDFDPSKIIKDYESMDTLREEFYAYKRNIDTQIHLRNDLSRQVTSLEYRVSCFEETINNLNELQSMGFGMKEFEQLSNLISGIALANNIDLSLSIKKFLKDVRSQYNNKLGFEATINQLNEEKRNIENEIPAYREYIHTKVSAIRNLDYLQDKGVTTIDVIGISLLMKAFLSGNFVLFPANTDANNKPDNRARNYSIQDWQIFIDDLKKLKDLKDEINDKKTE